MWYKKWVQVSFVLSQFTPFDRQADRQTYRQTDGKAFSIPCIALHAVAR